MWKCSKNGIFIGQTRIFHIVDERWRNCGKMCREKSYTPCCGKLCGESGKLCGKSESVKKQLSTGIVEK
jgi:hypothetical protein